MASSQEMKDAIAQKMAGGGVNNVATTVQPMQQDRFFKGTLIDDRVIEIVQKVATIIIIVAVLGALWLWTERVFSPRALAPWRVWTPSVFMVVMMFVTKPFLRLGWFGWAFVLVQSINLSGYLFQTIQSVIGVR